MSGFSEGGTGGFGPSSSFRFGGFRGGSSDGRNNTFRYPSPWWDAAHMELPTTVKHLFKWCRYHMLVNPLVSSVTKKMAAYPITETIIDDQPEAGFDKNKERWEDFLFSVVNLARFQVEAGLDYFGYGNCVVSILYPFNKHLCCESCKGEFRIKRLKFRQDWDFKNFNYMLTCPKCGYTGQASVKDVFYKSYRDIRLIRWNPQDLEIDFNPITQETEYAYTVPPSIARKVLEKHQRTLETTPSAFIQSVKTKRPIVLRRDNVFHFKAPTPSLSDSEGGWGYPPILPALKDSFYLQILKKAQEAIMLEHLVPLDIIYPASADATTNPYQMLNLSDWKRRIELELVKWRWDPNYKPILPLPVGYQRIGGDGKALLLTNEIRAWSEHIVAGMQVPQEFVFGGLSYSGSSVSLRMLENQFLAYRDMHTHFLKHFLIPNVARFMRWEKVSAHMRTFKMADDIQAKQILISLNAAKKLSDKSLLSEFDKDALEERRMIEQELRQNLEITKLEQLMGAAMMGEAQKVQTKYQIEAQEMQAIGQEKMQSRAMKRQSQSAAAMGGQQQPASLNNSVNVVDLADSWAKRMGGYQPQERENVLRQMQTQTPQLHKLIVQKMATTAALGQKPLPEQRPPQRGPASAVI